MMKFLEGELFLFFLLCKGIGGKKEKETDIIEGVPELNFLCESLKP